MNIFKKFLRVCDKMVTNMFHTLKKNYKLLSAIIGICYILGAISAIHSHSIEFSDITTLFEYIVSIAPEI